jgi:heme-degrading monooxygenase HmoA
MLCALAVRKLKPGTFEQFKEGFGPPDDAAQQGWVRFHMLRGLKDENEVVTFGFFDGTLDELNASQSQHDYEERVQQVAPFVDSVVSNGIYEIVVERFADAATA